MVLFIRGLALVLLTLVLVLSACASPPTTTAPSPTATSPTTVPTSTPSTTTTTKPPVSGPYGELRIALSSLGGERFDPVLETSTTKGALLQQMYDSLFSMQGSNIVGQVVEKWEIAPGTLSWIFHLRKDIQFHNGQPLTAKDVKFSLDRSVSPETYYSNLADMYERSEIVDDYTVRVYTKGRQPDLLGILSLFSPAQGLIMPKDYIEQSGIETFRRKPIGSGPFRFVRSVPGDLAEYEAFEKHWRNVPEFKKLLVLLIPEETTRVAVMKTGGVDMIDISIESATDLESGGFKTYPLGTFMPGVYISGVTDPRNAGNPVADIRVRQALSLAINRDEIRQSFFYGKAAPPPPPFTSPISTDIDVQYWMDYAAKVFRYDIEEAKNLLKQAGYANGFNLKLYSFSMRGLPYGPKLAEVVQGYWGKIGVRAEITPVDYGIWSRWRRGPANELIGNASIFRKEATPITTKDIYTGFHTRGSDSLLGPAYPEVDKLIDAALTEMDAAKRKEYLAKVIETTINAYAALVIAEVPSMVGVGPNVDITFPKPSPAIAMFADLAKHKK